MKGVEMSMKFTSGLVLGIVILAGVLGFAYYHYHAAGKTISKTEALKECANKCGSLTWIATGYTQLSCYDLYQKMKDDPRLKNWCEKSYKMKLAGDPKGSDHKHACYEFFTCRVDIPLGESCIIDKEHKYKNPSDENAEPISFCGEK